MTTIDIIALICFIIGSIATFISLGMLIAVGIFVYYFNMKVTDWYFNKVAYLYLVMFIWPIIYYFSK